MPQLLVAELTALGAEARRKYSEIKQATDLALNQLKDSPSAIKAYQGVPTNHPLLRPILLTCDTKAPKLISLAMALLQRIVLQQLASPDSIPLVVSTLHKLLTPINRSDVDVQLKILQIASALLSSYPSIHNELLSSTLLLCFKLQEGSKVAVVSSTAAATLRQSVMTVFDKVKDEDSVLDGIKAGGEDAAAAAPLAAMSVDIPDGSVTLFPASRDAYILFSDLCSLANGEQATFLTLSSLSKTFSLELIESVLTNHSRLFSWSNASKMSSHPELLFILHAKTCPLLIKALSETPSFPIHLRLMRLLFLLLRQFSSDLILEVEILMTMLLKFVHPSQREEKRSSGVQPWQCVLALEVVRSLCSDHVFLRNLWLWYDSGAAGKSTEQGVGAGSGSSRVFSILVETLRNVVKEKEGMFAIEPSMATSQSSTASASQESPRKSRVRESFDRSYSGLYEAAAGVANAAMSGVFSSGEASGTEALTGASSPVIQIIDQLDKTEAPQTPSAALPKTYIPFLALQSFLYLTQSLAGYALPVYSTFANSRPQGSAPAPPSMRDEDLKQLKSEADCEGLRASKEMLRCSAPTLRDSLTYFLQIKCSDSIFEEVLVAVRNLSNVTGALSLTQERDDMIHRIIAFAVHASPSRKLPAVDESFAQESASLEHASHRNLACLRALCQVSYYLSGSLEEAWVPVVRCLCQAHGMLELLGSKSSSNSGRRQRSSENRTSIDSNEGGNATLSTLTHTSMAAMDLRSGKSQLQLLSPADLQPAQLCKQILSVFENSTALDDTAFQPFVTALTRHSSYVADLGESQVEPQRSRLPLSTSRNSIKSLVGKPDDNKSFTISSVGLVAMLNVERLTRRGKEVGWSLITEHLLSICLAEHVPAQWRLQAAQVANVFLFGAIGINLDAESKDGKMRTQRQTLDETARFAILEHRKDSATDVEIRRLSVEHLYQILETQGHALLLGWETIFDICSASCETANPNAAAGSLQKASIALVKVAFSSVQIVCSDFLATLTLDQLKRCISCLSAFGTQMDDVNVALTANGCLWAITAEMSSRASASPDQAELSELWLFLLHCILQITRDSRSEVRNGAISNLFRVLEQYGEGLDPASWQKAVWEILIPMIKALDATAIQLEEDAGNLSSDADNRRRQAMGVAQSEPRQWDESRALALTSLASIFRDFMVLKLVRCDEFEQIWATIMDHVQASFLRGPPLISQASIKMLSIMLSANVSNTETESDKKVLDDAWQSAWKCWTTMGETIPSRGSIKDKDLQGCQPFTQQNLVAYVEAFSPIYRILAPRFDAKYAEKLFSCLKNSVAYVDSPDNGPDVDSLTALQAAARKAIGSLRSMPGLSSLVLFDLAENMCFAFTSSTTKDGKSLSSNKAGVTFVALAKACIAEALEAFDKKAVELEIYRDGAVERLFAALMVPIKLKYDCPPASKHAKGVRPLWQSATLVVCKIAQKTCQILDKEKEQLGIERVVSIWKSLIDVLDAALSADCSAAAQFNDTIREKDERFDLCLLAMIETQVLPVLGSKHVPDALIKQLGTALIRASELNPSQAGLVADDTSKKIVSAGSYPDTFVGTPRERYAYWCLDLALLACSDSQTGRVEERKRVAAFFLPRLLSRCEDVLCSYLRDASLRGMSPMPRVREEELNFVLSSYLNLSLWPSCLAAAFSDDPSAAMAHNTDRKDETVPVTPAGMQVATRCSTRAHLFAAYHHLCDLVGLRLPSGTLAVRAMTGTSLPLRVTDEQVEAELSAESLRLGMVGRRRSVFARMETEELALNSELARQALTVVASELGIPPRL